MPSPAPISVVRVDIGKNSFHIVGVDDRDAIVEKWSCGQVEARFANMSPCLIGHGCRRRKPAMAA